MDGNKQIARILARPRDQGPEMRGGRVSGKVSGEADGIWRAAL